MADKKESNKVPIPIPAGKIKLKKVQRVIAVPPHPEPKPKPKRKQLPKKEPEYAELNAGSREEPENNYQSLCSGTRERPKEKATIKSQNPHPFASEVNYDDICNQSCHQNSDNEYYENNPLRVVETNRPATKQTVKEGQKRSNTDLCLKHDGDAGSQSREAGYENLPLKAVETNKPATELTTEQKKKLTSKRSDVDLQPRYGEMHVQVPQEQDFKNYDVKVIDEPDDGILTEKDFNTNCCYAYRKIILMIAVILVTISIVVLFLAMITVALSQASQNAQEYQELEVMTQTMAEQILSLEQQLNSTLILSEMTSEAFKQQIMDLEEQIASSVNSLTSEIRDFESQLSTYSEDTSSELEVLESDVAVLRDDIDSLSDSTVPRSDFDQELRIIREEVRVQQEVISQQFMSDITTLTNKTEQLNSDLLQLTAHTIPIYCYMTINETLAVNAVAANSPSYQLVPQDVSVMIKMSLCANNTMEILVSYTAYLVIYKFLCVKFD